MKNELDWTTPAAGPAESMPLGNGVAGINLWVTADGAIRIYLAVTGAYSENARLLKLGRLVLRFDRPLDTTAFRWTLDPARGEIRIREGKGSVPGGSGTDIPGGRGERAAGDADEERDDSSLLVRVRLEVDSPTLRMEWSSATERSLSVDLQTWRTGEREISRDAGSSAEIHSAYGLSGAPEPVVVYPDTLIDTDESLLAWCHHNRDSIWQRSMELQWLADLCGRLDDPLAKLTFGAIVQGSGLRRAAMPSAALEDAEYRAIESGAGWPSKTIGRLQSDALRTDGLVSVQVHIAHSESPQAWFAEARSMPAVDADATNTSESRRCVADFWTAVDSRSYIEITRAPCAERINTAYRLQRFLLAWAARGRYPLKFNGSLFTVDWDRDGEAFDPDYRRWGGHFWFQNTRLSYWPMLVSGDLEFMDSFFDFYTGLIPLAAERTARYFGHAGVFFPETVTPWGTYADDNYGWDREGKYPSHVDNRYIRHYHQGTLELLTMALDRYLFSPDRAFLGNTLIPLAEAIIPFFDEHYGRANGRIRFYPSQSLETWQDAADPMPEIAGLWWTLSRLLALPDESVPAALATRARRMLGELPVVPLAGGDDGLRLAAAAEIYEEERNLENPELYGVFPYRLFALDASSTGKQTSGQRNAAASPEEAVRSIDGGLPLASIVSTAAGRDLSSVDAVAIGRRAFDVRTHPRIGGWCQDGIQAAYLGDTETAVSVVTDRIARVYDKARFPVFWGPNYDWVPDQDHGSVINMTLQSMLLQYDGDAILLFPAWPREWDVRFRLHAPRNTVVEAALESGRITHLQVEPEGRGSAVVLPGDLAG